MNLVDLQALYEYADGPVLTACLDVSRDSEAGQHELRLRWQGLREQLEDPAAGPQLDLAEQRLLAPTHLGGAVARTVVVRGVEVALDRVLPGPALPLVHRGPFPRLSGFLTAADRQVNHVVVNVDRTGADIHAQGQGADDAIRVTGPAAPVHKANAGGWSQLRWQHTVENSWERNVATVAEQVDRIVEDTQAEVVAVTGDPRARALLVEALNRHSRELTHLLDGGGRGLGQEGRLPDELTALLEDHAAGRARAAAEAFEQQRGRDGAAAAGPAEVVEALRAAKVDTLLLPPDWVDDQPAWYGPDATQLGTSRQEVQSLGVTDPESSPLGDLVLRAAVATAAAVRVLPPHILDLHGGPAAILRYTADAR